MLMFNLTHNLILLYWTYIPILLFSANGTVIPVVDTAGPSVSERIEEIAGGVVGGITLLLLIVSFVIYVKEKLRHCEYT